MPVTRKIRLSILTVGLLACLSSQATELQHWPQPQAEKLNQLIENHRNQGNYAVFDMDNTTYKNDLEEALIPWLENQKLLTRETLDPALKLIPFNDLPGKPESLYSYYHRLCHIDELICYPWAAQIFSGFTLQQLKKQVDAMLAQQAPVPASLNQDGQQVMTTVEPPRMLRGMQELFAKLQENGIRVYIMSAAHEELARMVASDPHYGYNVKAENVLGINTLLRNTVTGELTTARKQIREGRYRPEQNQQLQMTSYLMNPMTWYEGKAGSMLAYIDQWRKPILVGGDTLYSDTYMLLNSTDVASGGQRLWISRNENTRKKLDGLIKKMVSEQQQAGVSPDADKNWIVVQQQQLE